MLKNTAKLVHSRHRSINNFLMNLVAALAAYYFYDNKPEALGIPLNIQNNWFCFKLIPNSRMCHGDSGMKRGFGTVCFVTHALHRSQFSPSESPSRPFLRFRSVFLAYGTGFSCHYSGGNNSDSTMIGDFLTLLKF